MINGELGGPGRDPWPQLVDEEADVQHITIGFVEHVQDTITATGCSIARALEVNLRALDRRALLTLREAAFDLARVAELEIGRQDAAREATPVREGYKRTSDAGGISWRVYRPEVGDDAIRAGWDGSEGHAGGPGRSFARGLCIRRTTTRTLATQFAGLDV